MGSRPEWPWEGLGVLPGDSWGSSSSPNHRPVLDTPHARPQQHVTDEETATQRGTTAGPAAGDWGGRVLTQRPAVLPPHTPPSWSHCHLESSGSSLALMGPRCCPDVGPVLPPSLWGGAEEAQGEESCQVAARPAGSSVPGRGVKTGLVGSRGQRKAVDKEPRPACLGQREDPSS